MNLAIGKAYRFDSGNLYLSKEISKATPTAKWSPGPIYNTNGDYKYHSSPKIGFGKGEKNPLGLTPYEFEDSPTVWSFKLII